MIKDDPTKIETVFTNLKKGFETGKTKSLEFREKQLKNLIRGINEMENQFHEALEKDLGVSPFLSFLTSVAVTIQNIEFTTKNFKKWAAKRSVNTSMLVGPGKSYIIPEPFGVVLVIGSWNYPLATTLPYLASAIAAGNCVMLKPSEMAPHSSNMIAQLCEKYLDPECYVVVEGSVEVAKKVTTLPVDLIIFTGSTEKGKLVAKAAAENLTPVVLELGGKSPTIVDKDANLENAALRIVNGRFMNCGQTCIAPDYILAHKAIKKPLTDLILKKINKFYTATPKNCPDYSRIISSGHAQRLKEYLEEKHGGTILCGNINDIDVKERYVPPFIVDNPKHDSKMMKDEIFGPILPILEIENVDEAIKIINSKPKPLALYYFSSVCSSTQERIVKETSSGGILFNGTVFHFLSEDLPFGGIGHSGMGVVHGVYGFDQCSHLKPVLVKLPLNSFPLNTIFPPYTNNRQKIVKSLMKYMGFPQHYVIIFLMLVILFFALRHGVCPHFWMNCMGGFGKNSGTGDHGHYNATDNNNNDL